MSDTSTMSQAAEQPGTAPLASTATPADGPAGSTRLTGAALWTAIFALVVWVGFSIVLIAEIGKDETQWTRLAWVFGSIQAVAFAAAGAVFGTAVQQQSVNTAQQQAVAARKDANQQREAATKGRALAAAIQAEVRTQSDTGEEALTRMGTAGAPRADSADQVRVRHAQLSRAMFGELV